jgi:hypothetical protein
MQFNLINPPMRPEAHVRDRLLVVLVAFVVLLSHIPQAIAAPGETIGTTVRIVNLVTAEYETDYRRLATGDDVRQDELIEVSAKGRGEFRLRDDTKLALGPGSQLLLDEFVYNPDMTGGAIVLNLVRGTFRFITGIAAKPAYVIRTPTASITVRGTIFDVYIQDSGLSWLLLIEGAIEVCNEKGECRVHDEPGKLIRITPAGDVGNPVKWASLPQKQAAPFESAFPFVVTPPLIDPHPIFTHKILTAEPDENNKEKANNVKKKKKRRKAKKPRRRRRPQRRASSQPSFGITFGFGTGIGRGPRRHHNHNNKK